MSDKFIPSSFYYIEVGFLYKEGKIINSIEGMSEEEIRSLFWLKLPGDIRLIGHPGKYNFDYYLPRPYDSSKRIKEKLSGMLSESLKEIMDTLPKGGWKQLTANIRLRGVEPGE